MFAFNKTSLQKFVAIAVISSVAAQPVELAYAANHPFSSIKDVNIVNLTANVDWDYDGLAPMQLGKKGVPLTKDVIEKQILRETARSIYLMTEGRHRVGNVYVYKKSRYRDNVDIRLLNQTGRSNANVASWQVNGGTSTNYLSIETEDEKNAKYIYSYPFSDYGRVIAHEMGHYIYSVLDEYAGSAEDTKQGAGWPNFGDNVRSTIMNDSSLFTRFSVADDYPSNGTNQTAQARIYGNKAKGYSGGSQWEMLVTDPINDTAAAKKDHLGNRKLFEAFKGFAAPKNYKDLTKFYGVWCPLPRPPLKVGEIDQCMDGGTNFQGTPTEKRITTNDDYWKKLYLASGGSESVDAVDGTAGSAFENFKVIWADSPSNAPVPSAASVNGRTVPQAALKEAIVASAAAVSRDALLIDRTMQQAAFKEAIAASIAEVQSRTDNSLLAIVVSPGDGTTPIFPLKPVTGNKQEMVKALLSLARTDGIFDITKAYAQIDGLVNQTRGEADSSSIFLMTDAKREAVISESLGSDARGKRNAINVVIFDGPLLDKEYEPSSVYARKLNDLAVATGGESMTADSSQKAAKAIRNMSQVDDGMRTSFLTSSSYQPSVGAHKESTQFKASGYDETISVEWHFDPSDGARLSFGLVSPAGAIYDTMDPESNPAEGYVLIKLPNSDRTKIGDWRVETNYSGPTAETVEVEVSTESAVGLVPSMTGGSKSDNRAPVLRAIFSGDSPIIRAKVLANIYRTHDLALVLSNLELKDDGIGVDARPNDGSYAVDLSGLLPAGDYVVEMTAETNTDSAFSTNLPFAMGLPVPDVAVGAGVIRVESVEFSLEEDAPGVVSSSNRGGGCTVSSGPADAGLLVLLLAAMIGLGVRRRKNSGSD
jgi:MYXO-CTERM domain-containing protein